jgi:hypothetical protein
MLWGNECTVHMGAWAGAWAGAGAGAGAVRWEELSRLRREPDGRALGAGPA